RSPSDVWERESRRLQESTSHQKEEFREIICRRGVAFARMPEKALTTTEVLAQPSLQTNWVEKMNDFEEEEDEEEEEFPFPPRMGNSVKLYQDAHDPHRGANVWEDLYRDLSSAQKFIIIIGWRVTPSVL